MISPAPVALLVPVANLNRRNAAACWASNPKRAVVYVIASQGSICASNDVLHRVMKFPTRTGDRQSNPR
jgi:hypothetical protein